jgi:hypothetical protein
LLAPPLTDANLPLAVLPTLVTDANGPLMVLRKPASIPA